jgi:hypothetical protein
MSLGILAIRAAREGDAGVCDHQPPSTYIVVSVFVSPFSGG